MSASSTLHLPEPQERDAFLLDICNNPVQVYLNLVLEFVPETVFRISKHYSKSGQRMPTLFVKLYVFQMCRALAHIHAMGVCHRDIKPQNLLVNTHTHQLKLCDFGSAKVIPWQPQTLLSSTPTRTSSSSATLDPRR